MKLNLDPAAMAPRHITAEALALATWYDAHPMVRRLWAFRNSLVLRVVLTLEPTMDNSDTHVAWLGHGSLWTREIRSTTGVDVDVVLLDEPAGGAFDFDIEGEIVAAINWRDPTSFWKAD